MAPAPYRSVPAAVAVGAVVLTAIVGAVAADLAAPRGSVGATVVDVGVGLVFVVAALVAAGPAPQRLLVGAVGVAWLAASVLPVARTWHQAVLVLAVTLFPNGRLSGRRDAGPVLLAVGTASGILSQAGVAVAFLLAALLVGTDRRKERAVRGWPGLAAVGVAVVLGAVWTIARLRQGSLEPSLVLAVYESVLVLIAVTFPVAAHAAGRVRARIADGMVGAGQLTGLEGLTTELRRAVADPELTIYPWSAARGAYVDAVGVPAPIDAREGGPWLDVADGGRPVAVVRYAGTALDDVPTADAVRSAIRLTLTHQRLRDEQRERLAQLQDARARLVAATDLTREELAAQLRTAVQAPVAAARGHVAAATASGVGAETGDATVTEALGVAVAQLSTAGAELAALTAGVPTTRLGDGRLHAALSALAEGSPVPVALSLDLDARADQQTETALYYVCSEALANIAKHAGATMVTVGLRRAARGIELIVADDGRGGAHPGGSGLAGLSDRVAAHGGRLRVDSPPGAGTVITATLPA
jgi:signal transduction histidine kinase